MSMELLFYRTQCDCRIVVVVNLPKEVQSTDNKVMRFEQQYRNFAYSCF